MTRLIALFVIVGLVFATVSWANDNFIAGGTGSNTVWEKRNSNGGFITNGNLTNVLVGHCAVRLSNGNAFLAGGSGAQFNWEIRDPSGGLVSTGNLAVNRNQGFTCTLMNNGRIFIVGGDPSPISWEIRDGAGALVSNGNLSAPRKSHTTTILASGNIFIAGGGIQQGHGKLETPAGIWLLSILRALNCGLAVVIIAQCFSKLSRCPLKFPERLPWLSYAAFFV
jgi:hypothetical protein